MYILLILWIVEELYKSNENNIKILRRVSPKLKNNGRAWWHVPQNLHLKFDNTGMSLISYVCIFDCFLSLYSTRSSCNVTIPWYFCSLKGSGLVYFLNFLNIKMNVKFAAYSVLRNLYSNSVPDRYSNWILSLLFLHVYCRNILNVIIVIVIISKVPPKN